MYIIFYIGPGESKMANTMLIAMMLANFYKPSNEAPFKLDIGGRK